MNLTYEEDSITWDFTADEKRRWDYCKAFIDKFKALVPAHSRSFDPDTKQWAFSNAYETQFMELLVQEGFHVD